nr:hypothetical protein [Mesorhizobium sp. LNJC384A00]
MPKPATTTSTSVGSAASKRPLTATARPHVVTGASPVTETSLKSNSVSPEMRLAARSGSTADATHMMDEPENTSSVTLSGDRSARKMVGFSLLITRAS